MGQDAKGKTVGKGQVLVHINGWWHREERRIRLEGETSTLRLGG